jgi:hypothetical protein
MHFQTITDQQKTVDSGVVTRRQVDDKAAPSVPAAPSVKPVPPQDKPGTKPTGASSTDKPAATPTPATGR